MLTASKAALVSALSRVRIRAIGKVEKLMDIFSSAKATSPVIDRAVELSARHIPFSCAASVRQQSSKDPVIAFCNIFGDMFSRLAVRGRCG